ncbi:hypothetical protein G9A89_002338 [Geosiphon pyriformis]|nr:hypothetical protein G9A89_002338 [Geosiphon pyriformis]
MDPIDQMDKAQNVALTKRNTESQGKMLVTDVTTLEFLAKMARYANWAHCKDENIGSEDFPVDVVMDSETRELVAFFGSTEELSQEAWEKRKTIVSTYRPDSSSTYISIDEEWGNNVKKIILPLFKKISYFRNDKNEEVNISFTGHGIGGSYAILAALGILEIYKRKGVDLSKYFLKVITYGQPRTGLKTFANFVNSQKELKIKILQKPWKYIDVKDLYKEVRFTMKIQNATRGN